MARQVVSASLSDVLSGMDSKGESFDVIASTIGQVTKSLIDRLHLVRFDFEDSKVSMAIGKSKSGQFPTCGIRVWLNGYERNFDRVVGLEVKYFLASYSTQERRVNIQVTSPYFDPNALEEELAKVIVNYDTPIPDP